MGGMLQSTCFMSGRLGLIFDGINTLRKPHFLTSSNSKTKQEDTYIVRIFLKKYKYRRPRQAFSFFLLIYKNILPCVKKEITSF